METSNKRGVLAILFGMFVYYRWDSDAPRQNHILSGVDPVRQSDIVYISLKGKVNGSLTSRFSRTNKRVDRSVSTRAHT